MRNSSLPKMIGVRSIDMNHKANAMGNVRNGNGRRQIARQPATMVPTSIRTQLPLTKT